MSVTLEEASLLINNHGVLPSHFNNLLATLRRYFPSLSVLVTIFVILFFSKGTRLYNCFKNTSHYRYAFSPISYHLLPKLFQPPSHTCSSMLRDDDCPD